MSVFPLFREYMTFFLKKAVYKITLVDNCVLRMFDFGGQWFKTLKNRGR